MMKKNALRYLILIVGISSGICVSNAQGINDKHLSFDEVLNLSLKQNHSVKQANYLIDQKKEDYKASIGMFFPKIGLSANYVYLSEDITLDMTPVKESITPIYEGLSQFGDFSGVPNPAGGVLPDAMSTAFMRGEFAGGLEEINATDWNQMVQEQDFATVSVNAIWPIFTGGKIIAQRKAAKLDLNDAKFESTVQNNKLVSELVERYFGLCLARQAEQVRLEVLEAMESHLSDADKLSKQGMISHAEYLHAKVFYSEAVRESKKAARVSTIANKALLNSMSDTVNIDIYPVSNLFYSNGLEPIAYFKDAAKHNNPNLNKIENKMDLADIGVKVEIANYLPTIVVGGNYDVWNYDLSSYVPDWMLGVSLNWTLFDGTARLHKLKSAKRKVSQVAEFKQKAESDIDTGLEKYYQEAQMSLEQIQALEADEQFADEYFRITERSFNEGLASSTNVVDANLASVKIKIEKLEAAYQFDIALAKLLEISGLSNDFSRYQHSENSIYNTFKK